MIVTELGKFRRKIKKGKRLLGLDVGRKTIGMALSDRDWNYSTPERILIRSNMWQDMKDVLEYVAEENVGALVCGLPLNQEGEETSMCVFVRNFVEVLDENTNLPIYMANEYLSSFVAEEIVLENMSSSYERMKRVIDKIAAAQILEDVLEELKSLARPK
jgi:putative Holliday junction resolvase